MKSGDLKLVPAGDPLSPDLLTPDPLALHEQSSLQPADPATHDEAFRTQQQKIQRLNQYYNEVVAELLTLLNESEHEVA
jgi:hypothetical protein